MLCGVMELHQKLRAKRLEAGLTKLAVAKFVGVNASSYLRWERGDTEPKFSARLKLAELFQVPAAWLQDDREAA